MALLILFSLDRFQRLTVHVPLFTQTGFGLAIAAAVLSLVSSALGWVGRFLPKDTELQVVSAVPVQIYTDNNGQLR